TTTTSAASVGGLAVWWLVDASAGQALELPVASGERRHARGPVKGNIPSVIMNVHVWAAASGYQVVRVVGPTMLPLPNVVGVAVLQRRLGCWPPITHIPGGHRKPGDRRDVLRLQFAGDRQRSGVVEQHRLHIGIFRECLQRGGADPGQWAAQSGAYQAQYCPFGLTS